MQLNSEMQSALEMYKEFIVIQIEIKMTSRYMLNGQHQ